MLEPILVPLDRSSFAEQALPHAVVLARQRHSRLQLVSVRVFPFDGGAEQSCEPYLARIAAQLQPELPTPITHIVLHDELAPAFPPLASTSVPDLLARYARDHGIGMFVMATHGRSGLRRAWLGSVADTLIRIAPRPVLLIRPTDEPFGSAIGADHGFRHIMIPVDGSELAEAVIPYALELGRAFSARYSLVRVLSHFAWGSYEVLPSAAPPLSRRSAREYLERLAESIREQGASVTTRVLEAAPPGPAIVHTAEAIAADAIVLATSGAGPARRLLLGSVTDRIVRNSPVPVLVCNIHRMEPIATRLQPAETVAVGADSA